MKRLLLSPILILKYSYNLLLFPRVNMGAGCLGNKQPVAPSKLSNNTIVTHLQKLKHVFEREQQRKQQSLKQEEELLIGQFGKPNKARSPSVQKAMIGRTTYTKNIKIIYLILQNEVKKILDYKDIVQKWQTVDTLIPSINTLIYCSSFLNDEELTRFASLIRQKFPKYKEPSDTDIRQELIVFHRNNNDVTFEMENTFILEFSHKYNIQIQRINEVGHHYLYSAGTVSYVLN